MYQFLTIDQLAVFIGVSRKTLIYYAFRVKLDNFYYEFDIPKRSGGVRRIQAPTEKLQLLQRNLAKALGGSYQPRVVVNGFLKDRNIKENAAPHVNARWLVNLDIEDFFRSINFGRVRGLFLSHPFNASHMVATGLARICCYKGSLAVGAPTSPIVSNLICRRLDRNLMSISRQLNLKVSRYADDITLSSKKSLVPEDLAELDASGIYIPGQVVRNVIVSNGFSINHKKFHVRTRHNRQEVTGLVVNRRVNVDRSYIRNIWQVLHAWQKFGLVAAAEHHFENFPIRGANNKSVETFERKITGRIMFVRDIRGATDPIYIKLAQALRSINPTAKIPIDRDLVAAYNAVWVHDAQGTTSNPEDTFQGTVFYLDGVGICGAAHCIGTVENEIYFPGQALGYKCSVISQDIEEDWAVLQLNEEMIGPGPKALKRAKALPKINQRVKLLGYPKYGPGSSITSQSGTIIGSNIENGVTRYKIDCPIIVGNSGGPVLDDQDRVIGIAVKGNESFSAVGEGENLLIPIQLIKV